MHNAYRRRPSHLPPAVAAAKFSRLSELLLADPACLAFTSAASFAGQQPQQPPAPPATGARRLREPTQLKARVPGLAQVLREIGASWDVFLHLYGARQLAACVRAAAETGLILSRREWGPAATASAETGAESGGSASSGSSGGSGSASPAASAAGAGPAAGSRSGGEGRGLLQRSLDVLLDRGGQELAAAGPQVRCGQLRRVSRRGRPRPGRCSAGVRAGVGCMACVMCSLLPACPSHLVCSGAGPRL